MVEMKSTGLTSDQPPSIGRIVHYVLETGRGAGQHRPALVVNVLPDDRVNLVVFIDGRNDLVTADQEEVLLLHKFTVSHDRADKAEGTYHWPEYVAPRKGLSSELKLPTTQG